MEIIEKFERTKRGLFSGMVGYLNPEGDFDFNVVIRSLLYNNENKYLSIQAGSAITFKSIPEKEYEECIIKIEAMKKALGLFLFSGRIIFSFVNSFGIHIYIAQNLLYAIIQNRIFIGHEERHFIVRQSQIVSGSCGKQMVEPRL